MSITIKNFQSKLGIKFKEAYLLVSQLSYLPKLKTLNFTVDIYSSKDSFDRGDIPVEISPFSGSIIKEDDLGFIEAIEQAILTKISDVSGKTAIECSDHNRELAHDWLST